MKMNNQTMNDQEHYESVENTQQQDSKTESKEPVISFKHVDVCQGKRVILTDVNLEINKGEFVYIIGKTGSGKSNFLKMIYGDVNLTCGQLYVAGFNLQKIKFKNVQKLRRRLGIVFQDYQLLHDRTVYENLHFITTITDWKNKSERHQRIEDMLKLVGLQDKSHKMPHQLSGGEQQRVCIARALINKPLILLADEPTRNLDPESSYEIFTIFQQIAQQGTTVLIATHDYLIMNQIPAKFIQIENGKLIY
jgi:cell division transport system ATP-binding protein